MIPCAFCRMPFTPHRPNHRYCCADCRTQDRTRTGSRARRERAQERRCSWCETPFRTNKATQHACSGRCRDAAYRASKGVNVGGTSRRASTPKPSYVGGTVACRVCGTEFTRTVKRRVFCSDGCRIEGVRVNAEMQVVVVPADEEARHTRTAAGHFTDDEFYAELEHIERWRIEQGLPLRSEVVSEASNRTVRGSQVESEPGTCDRCGGAYRWPVRREGGRYCGVQCADGKERLTALEAAIVEGTAAGQRGAL